MAGFSPGRCRHPAGLTRPARPAPPWWTDSRFQWPEARHDQQHCGHLGLPEQEAQTQALERIGPVHVVAGRPALTRPSAPLLRHLALTAALVGGAGFAAIGVAGIVGRFLNTAKGNLFMTPPFPPGTYTAAVVFALGLRHTVRSRTG